MAEIGTTEILLIGVGGYLAYSLYTSTGLFAPAAAAAPSAAPAPAPSAAPAPAATTPVAPAPAPAATATPAVTSARPPVTSAGNYTPGLVNQSPWAMRPGRIQQLVQQTTQNQWSATATYTAGQIVLYTPAGGGHPSSYVNLTGQNAGAPSVDTTDWAPVQWSAGVAA
jgi:pyruvate/2-oxoglutarate dehydrogenase complex dihydrolipoamide acyltransferase (E2) component